MRLGWLLFLIVGCTSYDIPADLPCSVGGECPPGFACDGFDHVCRIPGGRCGDDVRNLGERCDDGNAVAGDGCRADCRGLELCHDGLTDVTEECDDGNDVDGDGCDSNCTASACGNGITAGGEVCDDGNAASGDGCRADCGKLEVCGDQVLDAGELCDDANILYGDGCRGDCTGFEMCGDGLTDMDEACDGQSGCNEACGFTTCGNGIVEPGELCPQLGAPQQFSGLSGRFLAAADFNGDGHVDLVMGDSSEVFLGDGTGAYVTSFTTITPGFSSAELIDIDRDQDVDLVGLTIQNQTAQITVHVNDGTGKFDARPPSLVTPPDLHAQQSFALADLNGDGRLDVISTTDAAALSIARGTATGFGVPTTVAIADGDFPFGVGTVLVAAGDVNGDGHVDVVATITTQPRHELITLLNDGAGNLAVAHTVVNIRGQGKLALADVDRDDDLDVIIMGFDFPHIPNGALEVFKNPGDGKFASSQMADTGGQGGGGGTLADVDGDGDLDVVIKAGSRISIVRNEGGVFGAPYRVDGSQTFQEVTVADVDDDQAMDLLWIDFSGGCPGCSSLNVLRADP